MSDKREALAALHRAGKSDSTITKTFLIARLTVWKALTRFNEKMDLSDHPRNARPCTQTKG